MLKWIARFVLLVVALPALAAPPTAVWFKAADGLEIRGDLYEAEAGSSAPMILLFHQAASNRGEYAQIAPRLNGLGFHALAVDQRSGGPRWGYTNETVEALGESTIYLPALQDLEAALTWKKASKYDGKALVWGSSYSAALVFMLAAKHDEIAGVLSFSPGEYIGSRKDEVRRAALEVSQPVFVATPEDERDRARPIFDVIPGEKKTFLVPDRAVHGSSMLMADRNGGSEQIWTEVQTFLAPFLK